MVIVSVSVFQMEWFLYACHEEMPQGTTFTNLDFLH
jgi:hypothetical protein